MDPAVDIVLTTGGTGLTGRDGTPEAVKPLFDKLIEGFGEMFRWVSYEEISTSTIQSRVTAGVANGTYIFACRALLEHAEPDGTKYLPHNSISAAGPVISRKCCQDSLSIKRRVISQITIDIIPENPAKTPALISKRLVFFCL